MVPNSVLVNNTELILKTYDFLEYVLDHQDETGWLGPEVGTEKPRFLWGRYPFFFGAIQLVEVDPSLTDRVVDAMHRFVKVANKMLKRGEGVDDWAATRWEDFVIALQWYVFSSRLPTSLSSHPGYMTIIRKGRKSFSWIQ